MQKCRLNESTIGKHKKSAREPVLSSPPNCLMSTGFASRGLSFRRGRRPSTHRSHPLQPYPKLSRTHATTEHKPEVAIVRRLMLRTKTGARCGGCPATPKSRRRRRRRRGRTARTRPRPGICRRGRVGEEAAGGGLHKVMFLHTRTHHAGQGRVWGSAAPNETCSDSHNYTSLLTRRVCNKTPQMPPTD